MSVSPHIWHVCMSRSVCELACVTNSATGTFYSPWGSYIHRSLPVYRLTPRLSWATLRYTHLLHLSSWHIRQCNCSWKESINKTLYFWHLVTQTFIIQNQFFCPATASNHGALWRCVWSELFPFDGERLKEMVTWMMQTVIIFCIR